MNVFAHREDGRGLCPRHPIVCFLNLAGVCMAIVFAMYRPIISLSLLPVAITAQYGASCFYHWLPYNKARQTIDHLMIAVLITATYVQYWLRSLPPTEASWRIWTLGAVTVIVLLVRLALPKYGKLRGILYLALGLVDSSCRL